MSSLILPYQSSGQELGETRLAMTRDLMQKDIEPLINKLKDRCNKYYILVHVKPVPGNRQIIWKKIMVLDHKPSMFLSCLLFSVDNSQGKLMLEWALPGDWPTWSVGGTQEPVPETIASVTQAGVHYYYDELIPN